MLGLLHSLPYKRPYRPRKTTSKLKLELWLRGARYQFGYEVKYFSLSMKMVGRIRSDLELGDLASQKMAWLVKPVCRNSC